MRLLRFYQTDFNILQLAEYTDLSRLKTNEESRQLDIDGAKSLLLEDINELRMINRELQSQISQAQHELDTFPDFHELDSIEKRWKNNEQVNFSLQSAIQAKETNTEGLQAITRQRLADFNTILVEKYATDTFK